MVSLMLLLPSLLLHLFPSLRVDHTALLPWLLVEPHCATQAASGFPDSKCRREKEMHKKRLQVKAWASLVRFFQAWYTRHIVGFFLSLASSVQGEPVLSGVVGNLVGGNGTEWLGEISNHRTGPANTQACTLALSRFSRSQTHHLVSIHRERAQCAVMGF